MLMGPEKMRKKLVLLQSLAILIAMFQCGTRAAEQDQGKDFNRILSSVLQPYLAARIPLVGSSVDEWLAASGQTNHARILVRQRRIHRRYHGMPLRSVFLQLIGILYTYGNRKARAIWHYCADIAYLIIKSVLFYPPMECGGLVIGMLLLLSGDIESNPGPSTPLTLKTIFNALHTVSHKWFHIGLQLDVPVYHLNSIEANQHNTQQQMCSMLEYWMSNATNPLPSWRVLVDALKAAPVGENKLAQELEEGYCRREDRSSLGEYEQQQSSLLEQTREQQVTIADSHRGERSRAAVFASENRQAINGKFATFVKNVCKKLAMAGVDLREFRVFVANLFPPGNFVPRYPTDLTEVFEAITHHGLWDCLHYSPLVQIVQNFGASDPEMKAWIMKYKKDLKAYTIVAKIEDHIELDLDTCIDQSQVSIAKNNSESNCPIEWKTDFVDNSLQHLIDVWEIFSVQYLVPDSPPTALLDRVRTGCLSVTWLVPSQLIPQLVKRAKVNTTFFQKHRILKVTVSGEIIYEEEVAMKSIKVDSPSLLQRGLPHALPGLEEVTVESVKEGTQYESGEFQDPPQLPQGSGFRHITYEILSYIDNAQSLCRAEQVCRDWYHVVGEGLLWKKLIEKKMKTDSVWRGLSERRGWRKYLFQYTPSGEVTHQFYKHLYTNIIRDIDNLQMNWKSGDYTLTRIECHSKKDEQGVECLQYDDNKIVSGHHSTIKIWDRKSLSVTTELQGHTGPVECLQYDDRVIVTGSDDSTIRVWDVNDGSLVNRLDHHSNSVLSLRFNSDTLVTGSLDETVAVWDMISPMDIFLRKELTGHTGRVYAVDFDENYIVSGSWDKTIKVWQTSTGELVHTLHGHRDVIRCLQYRGKHIVSGSYDSTIRIWDIDRGACLRVLEGHNNVILSIRFDDRRIVSGGSRGVIKVWDFQAALNPRSQADTLCLQTLREHSSYVKSLQFDDFQIISGSDDDSILIWDFLDPVPPAN